MFKSIEREICFTIGSSIVSPTAGFPGEPQLLGVREDYGRTGGVLKSEFVPVIRGLEASQRALSVPIRAGMQATFANCAK
jgi:hypothetical protein